MSKFQNKDWWLGRTEEQKQRKQKAKEEWRKFRSGNETKENVMENQEPQQTYPVVMTLKWTQRHPWALALIAFFVGAMIGVAGGSSNEPEGDPIATEVPDTSGESEPADEAVEEPPAEPKGKFQVASCDLGLSNENYHLVGSTRVINTGEVPAKVKVTFRWQLGDGSSIKAGPKQASLGVGTEKLVFFKIPPDINIVSNFQNHPDYGDNDQCKTKAIFK